MNGSSPSDDRIAELEKKIADLQAKVAAGAGAAAEAAPLNTDGQAAKDINYYSYCAAAASLLPAPLIDMAAVTAVQVRMVKRLAHLCDQNFDEESGKALASALTGATLPVILGRGGAKLAVKTIPVVGQAIAIATLPAFNFASTRVVGHYFQNRFKSPAKDQPKGFPGLAEQMRVAGRQAVTAPVQA